MKQNNYGEIIFNETDVCDLIMEGDGLQLLSGMLVDNTVNIEKIVEFVDEFPTGLVYYTFDENYTTSMPDWDAIKQQNWHMPKEYVDLDIAEYILGLCTTDAELQRCGQELLLYQERNLFSLLKYLKYLIDVMIENRVIWGVGRGSSVASYVLYKIGVHRVDSMFYELDIDEFLR